MLIRVNLRALQQVKAHEYVTRFALGGAVVVLTGMIAEHFGPIVGGVFLAFPAIFPASATLMEHHERQKKSRAGIPLTLRGRLSAALDARGATLGACALGLFALAIWKLLPIMNAGI